MKPPIVLRRFHVEHEPDDDKRGVNLYATVGMETRYRVIPFTEDELVRHIAEAAQALAQLRRIHVR